MNRPKAHEEATGENTAKLGIGDVEHERQTQPDLPSQHFKCVALQGGWPTL